MLTHLTALRLFLCAVILLWAPVFTGAQEWDSFPQLPPSQQVAVKLSLDGPHWDLLRSCLKDFESAVNATYFAAVVDISSSNGSPSPDFSDAIPYVEALYQAWKPNGRLDPSDHILMVIAIQNRVVAVHPGLRWADRGFSGGAIKTTVDASEFPRYARGGDHAQALCALAGAIDAELARRVASAEGAAVAPPRLDEIERPPQTLAADRDPLDRETGGGAQDRDALPTARSRGDALRSYTLTWILGLLLLGVLLLGLVFQRRRCQRARQRMRGALERWRTRLGHAADHLLDLENCHPLYFTAPGRRWSGQTQSLDAACADAVNHVYLLYSKAFELRDEAEQMAARAEQATLDHRPFEAVWELLHQSTIRLETGEAEERRRIFSPLRQQYEGTAATLLDDLDGAHGVALARLDELAAVVERRREQRASAEASVDLACSACDRRDELGLPSDHLRAALVPLLTVLQEVDGSLAVDPVAANARLDQLLEPLATLAARGVSGNATIDELRGPIDELGRTLRREIERLRTAGFKLQEPGFQPDLRLDRAAREAQRIAEQVARGKEEIAAGELVDLGRGLRELADQLRASEAARDGVPAALLELDTAVDGLQRRLPEGRANLAFLHREHAETGFEGAADNLDELASLLAQVGETMPHIRDDHQAERYLSALADLEDCHELLTAGHLLMDEIAHARAELDAARDRAGDRLARCREAREEAIARSQAEGLGSNLRARHAEWAQAVDALGLASEAPTPHWPQLDAELAQSEATLHDLRAAADRAFAEHRQCQQLETEVTSFLRDLERRVEAERRDRPHVQQALNSALEIFSRWRAELATDDLPASELLILGRQVETAAHQAQSTWVSELEIIRQAEVQYQAAAKLGARYPCPEGRSVLTEVETWRQEQAWERALQGSQEAYRLFEANARRAQAEKAERTRRALELQEQLTRQNHLNQISSLTSATSSRPSSSRSSFSSRSSGSSFRGSSSGGSSW